MKIANDRNSVDLMLDWKKSTGMQEILTGLKLNQEQCQEVSHYRYESISFSREWVSFIRAHVFGIYYLSSSLYMYQPLIFYL